MNSGGCCTWDSTSATFAHSSWSGESEQAGSVLAASPVSAKAWQRQPP